MRLIFVRNALPIQSTVPFRVDPNQRPQLADVSVGLFRQKVSA